MIQSEKEYNDKLSRIEKIMDAEHGTPEGSELDLLANEIQEYEEKYYPLSKPTKTDIILYTLNKTFDLKEESKDCWKFKYRGVKFFIEIKDTTNRIYMNKYKGMMYLNFSAVIKIDNCIVFTKNVRDTDKKIDVFIIKLKR